MKSQAQNRFYDYYESNIKFVEVSDFLVDTIFVILFGELETMLLEYLSAEDYNLSNQDQISG